MKLSELSFYRRIFFSYNNGSCRYSRSDQRFILPTVNNLVSDPIPNIRFNVAKSYEVLIPVLKQSQETVVLLDAQVKPALDKLREDSDADVKYFAEKALLAGYQ
ncbi:unnamed protein product [Rhizophagus irregularis]|nr:unnamed protein product [Rhizophagus irregularis]